VAEEKVYDAAIVGGGLAGLSLSIQLARLGHTVILFEKENYPFHKVCGEYISLESWDFLNNLGVDLDSFHVPIIHHLEVSSAAGKMIRHHLPLGGFGISRYTLDARLAQLARDAGVLLLEGKKVSEIYFEEDLFTLEAGADHFKSRVACAGWGKRSNVDIKWKRKFSIPGRRKLDNFIGVKYHVQGDFANDTISLHNFKNGYCGLAKIESGLYNLCYLTTADNLKNSGGDIRQMEQDILSRNPYLKKIFSQIKINDPPLTISQISFDKKTQVEHHVLMTGDAAGMITPLCGNGMSMALHASKLAATQVHHFLQGSISREKMEKRYSFQWQRHFRSRLRAGRIIQRLFRVTWLSNMVFSILKRFPAMLDKLIRATHGRPFVFSCLCFVVNR
jgi:flavin-dependent dehydrogenase